MKKSDIYEITVKMLGLYLFFTSIGFLHDMLTTYTMMLQARQNPEVFGSFNQVPILALSTLNFILVALFATLLTFKTKNVVKLICKPSDYEEHTTLFTEQKVVYQMALVIMGLILFTWTLPDFALQLKQHFQVTDGYAPASARDANFMLTSTVKLLLALLAIFYARTLSSFFAKK